MHLCCYQSFTMKKDLYKYSRAYSLPVFEPVFKKSFVWSSRCSFVFVDPSLRFFLGVHKEWDGIVWLPKTSFWPSWPNFLRHFLTFFTRDFWKNSFWGHGLKRMQVPKKLELVLGGALLRQAIQKGTEKKWWISFDPCLSFGWICLRAWGNEGTQNGGMNSFPSFLNTIEMCS